METLQMPCELADVVKLYRERGPKRVLEIGCWDGGTLKEWLTQGEPDVVVAVDVEHRHPELYDEWRKEGTELVVLTGDSWAEGTRENMRAHAPYDWVFIDGDHSRSGVLADWKFARSVVGPCAVVCFHDIVAPWEGGDAPGVLVDELEAVGFEVRRIIGEDPEFGSHSHGIGMVFL